MLLASGVALAINTIQCKTNEFCDGTDKRDLMKGSEGQNFMFGHKGADVLKGRGGGDDLVGGRGDDRLVPGSGGGSLSGDAGDDVLRRGFFLEGGTGDDRLLGRPGGGGLDGGPGTDVLRGDTGSHVYHFSAGWGDDKIVDTEVRANDIFKDNQVYIHEGGVPLTVNLNSDSGPAPELTDGLSTVNWSGDVIDNVLNGSALTDDRIVGNDAGNRIISRGQDSPSGAPPPEYLDSDTVLANGGDDRIDVRDADGNDTVGCGAGEDTVYYNEGDELIVPDDCENKNPPYSPF